MSTPRRRRPAHRRRADRVITAAVVLVCVALGWLSLQARSGLPGVARYTVSAPFADLANLREHDDVRIAGVRVGQVLRPRQVGGQAVIELSLDDGLRLARDTRAVVRSRGLLGARFLELRPGVASATVPDGGRIALARTAASRDLADVLDTFDRETRADLRTLVDGGGRGLSGRGGDLNDTLREVGPLWNDLGQVADAITARPGAAARLLPSLRATTSAIDPVAERLSDVVAAQGDAARPFADAADDVSATIRRAPDALDGVRTGLRDTDPLLHEARLLARTTAPALADAPQGLRDTAELLAATDRPLRRTTAVLRRATRSAPPVRRLVSWLPPTLEMLDDTIEHGTPIARKVAGIQCDIHSFGVGWASMLGVALRSTKGDPEVGPLTSLRLTVTPTPDTLNPAVTALTGSALIGTNAYPSPCEAGTEKLG